MSIVSPTGKNSFSLRIQNQSTFQAVGSESKNSVFSRLGGQEAGGRAEVKVEETEKSSVFNRLQPANKVGAII